MQKINWKQFEIKNENYRKSFEDLCYHLFCRKFNINEGIKADFNQAGLETEPVLYNGKYYGFQSKYFDHTVDYGQIRKSIEKALVKYTRKLDYIIIYLNTNSKTSSKSAQSIKNIAQKNAVTIEWIVSSNFEILLNQPINLDLAQLYFGFGDEIGFIKDCCDPNTLTFLQSLEYLELPFIDSNKNITKDVKREILTLNQKEFLITGHPGSGKSIFMHKLFQEFAGLDQKTETDMVNVLEKNKAIPILINLKKCLTETLENLILAKRNSWNLNGRQYTFIYLFDGLDELSEDKAENVLLDILQLRQNNNTKKIIISCRSGNLNKIKLKGFLSEIIEFQIGDLDKSYIEKFFNSKNDTIKNELLKKLNSTNEKLIIEIKDILLIKLLWDTIDELSERSTIIDLLEKKIELLLNNPNHRKNLEELNLLNPKREKIITLNKEISYEIQKRYQFRYPLLNLQELILKTLSRLDYKSVNVITTYLADLFFENSYSINNEEHAFIYQHRRYQEFFFALKLVDEYEKDPKILRNLRVLSNREFFEKIFLTFLRRKYEKENNLIGIIELNLIDLYLGKHKGWGADDAYYMNSHEFIPALVSQQDTVFEEILADENLAIKEKIIIDIDEVNEKFKKWKKDKKDFYSIGYLKNIWEKGVAALLKNAVIFWKANKRNIANDMRDKIVNIVSFFEENKFLENLRKEEHPKNPFREDWESLIYINIVIKDKPIIEVMHNLIRKKYRNVSSDQFYRFEESEKDKLIKSFIRVCLKEKSSELPSLIDDFDDIEFIALLEVLTTIDFLPIFIKQQSIQNKIKARFNNLSDKITERNLFILFYKKYFGLKLTENELEFIKAEMSKIRKERQVDWIMYKLHFKFALLSYSIGENKFVELLKSANGYLTNYYNELSLYSALFYDYIEMIQNRKTINTIVRDYISYVNSHDDRFGLHLKVDISFLWSYIFNYCEIDLKDLSSLKRKLFFKDYNLIFFSFLYKLSQLNKDLFNKLVNGSELMIFEDELIKWKDDYPSYVDRCFNLALFYSGINKQKAIQYISKGINDGIIRHGWRKDGIVSYLLVEALEILWRNNWGTRETLEKYSKTVFRLTIRVTKITDGRGTWRGPYNVIDMVSKYDIELAELLMKELSDDDEYHSYTNLAITSVLVGKVHLGLDIEEIEKEMHDYRYNYNFDGKPRPDYYEQKFCVYIAIAQCDMYSEEEKQDAFEKAYLQIEEMRKNELQYYLRDSEYKDEKLAFIELCNKYNKECNVTFDENEKMEDKVEIDENDFCKEIESAKTKKKIISLYKKLGDYKNGIVLKKLESWRTLVIKTYEVFGNIELFIRLLQNNNFPHSDFWTSNSKYFHLGLAVALGNINTKQETMRYLYENTGHGGFVNIMKAYEVNDDKTMCLKLFERYLQFCDFLVN